MEKATPGELDVMLTREQREIAVSADTHIDLETVQSITQQHALTRKKQSVVSNKATLGSSEGGNFADLNEDSLIPVDINHTHINEQNHRTNINENNLMWRLENASEWLLNAKNIILQEKLTQALKECIRVFTHNIYIYIYIIGGIPTERGITFGGGGDGYISGVCQSAISMCPV